MSPRYTRPVSRGPSFDEVRRNYARTVHREMEGSEDGINAFDCGSARPAPGLSVCRVSICIFLCRLCFCWVCLCLQCELCEGPGTCVIFADKKDTES